MIKKWLIDADALDFQADERGVANGVWIGGKSGGKTMQLTLNILRHMIDHAPTVDAVEVVHAKWGYHRGKLCCRNCGFEPSYSLYSRDGFSNSNYCPNCGAKMDGDGNG